jgi:hypothetical protein
MKVVRQYSRTTKTRRTFTQMSHRTQRVVPDVQPSVLDRSTVVGAWLAKDYIVGEQVLRNRVTANPNMQLGSSASADANDPLFLSWTGVNYVYLPGTAGNTLVRSSDGTTISSSGNHLTGCVPLSSTQVVDSEGQVWTVNRSASGLKSVIVNRPLFLLGGSHYFQAANNTVWNIGSNESFTVVMAFRHHANIADPYQVLFGRKTGGGLAAQGWLLYLSSGGTWALQMSDGVNQQAMGIPAVSGNAGSAVVVAGGKNDTGRRFASTTWERQELSHLVSGSISSSAVLRIGALSSGTPTNFAEVEFIGAAFLKGESLTEGAVNILATELLAL